MRAGPVPPASPLDSVTVSCVPTRGFHSDSLQSQETCWAPRVALRLIKGPKPHLKAACSSSSLLCTLPLSSLEFSVVRPPGPPCPEHALGFQGSAAAHGVSKYHFKSTMGVGGAETSLRILMPPAAPLRGQADGVCLRTALLNGSEQRVSLFQPLPSLWAGPLPVVVPG